VLTSQTMQELDKKLRSRCSRAAGDGGKRRSTETRKGAEAARDAPQALRWGCVEGASLWLLKVVTRASSYFGAP
jgi:hypothetical protein